MDCITIPSFVNFKTFLVGTAGVVLLSWMFGKSRDRLPPGPRSWPLIGSLLSLAAAPGQPHEVFRRLARRYGPVMKLDILGQRIVVLHGYRAIREAFQSPYLNDRPELHSIKKMMNGSEGVVSASGNIWKEHRKLSLHVFKNFGVGKASFEEQVSVEASHLVHAIGSHQGQPFDPSTLLITAVSDIIAAVVYGRRFDYDDPGFQSVLGSIRRNLELVGVGAALQFLPVTKHLSFLPVMREMRRNIVLMVDFTRRFVDEHLNNFDPNHARDFMDMYIKAMRDKDRHNEPNELSVNNLICLIIDLFVAGTETVSTTLRWGLIYMVRYPDVQERVQREIDSVVGPNRLPKMADKPSLPYTEATLHELQRISSIAPLGVPHRASEETTFMGYTIPKDSFIIANHWDLNFDPDVFPDPEMFKPERFLNSEGQVTKPDELMPFGTGRRMCLGEQLARMELFIIFTHVLHQFTIRTPTEGANPPNLKGVLGATYAPEPFEICAVPRYDQSTNNNNEEIKC